MDSQVKRNIPSLSYINTKVITDLERESETFRQIISEKAETLYPGVYNNREVFRLNNQSHIAGLLYCLLVVPREIWARDRSHSIYSDLDKHGIMKFFNIILPTGSMDNFKLIRHLRNCIAHARFEIAQPDIWIFEDADPNTAKLSFQATTDLGHLSGFLEIVANLFHPLGWKEATNSWEIE